MASVTSFVKMEGLGNDFVVVDRRDAGTPVDPAHAIALCNRHRGIGADGVLSLLPSREAPLAMHVTNSDGTVAEMCGNGLRCVVRYAVARGLLPASGGRVETGRGILSSFVEDDGQIRVDMGAPEIDREPVTLELPASSLAVTVVSMGNPHAVAFVDGGWTLAEWARRLGPEVEQHPRFPHRTNAEFARVLEPGVIDLVVWERGAGLTLACGTGACATAVAAIVSDRVSGANPLRVLLPGGELRIRVEPDLSRVWMTGPAVEVFTGQVGN